MLFLSVTAVGYETGQAELVSRAGARPGDLIGVTGELGGAAAALLLLKNIEERKEIPAGVREKLLTRQLNPRPRLDEGHALAETGAMAMIDISDGLGGDAGHIAKASGCRIEIDADKVPVVTGVAEVAGGRWRGAGASGQWRRGLRAARRNSRGGFCQGDIRGAKRPDGVLTEIGYVVEGQGVALRLPGGGEIKPRGFDQRRGSLSGSG